MASSSTLDLLIEMGFSKEKAELAISKTGSNDVQAAMEWILTHNEEPTESTENQAPASDAGPTETDLSEVKSIKCDDCGKLFASDGDMQFHASKTGHANYSHSTEEKKPLTEEEKKEQLAKIEAKLRQRRLDREAREKHEDLEREKTRIKSGKELLEAKRVHEELEMKKLVEQRRREKEEDRLAKQRVREQIEQDKLARKERAGCIVTPEKSCAVPASPKSSAAPKSPTTYNEVKLQIRLTNGESISETFGAKEPLSAVRLFIEMNRTDGTHPFNLMMTFPRKVFEAEDYNKPLGSLGLAPSAVLILSKATS